MCEFIYPDAHHMRHATLYRRWRPRRFSEISGQEPVVRTLRRAIETDRVSHAYLFSGPRGTGKTSTAKVLAMGLNCVQGPTPEPDGTCDSCRAIINNSSLDVVEMDAASNRGIDEIRDLRDRVNLSPVQGRVKVYIIDEVHMLTAEAFNALLKMLEEPPEHVVFVLATTERHKVLPTIVSRCQTFDFRRPGVPVVAQKLKEISDAEGIEAEPEALTLIAREGKGSFRDAEGLLDQLSSFAEGPITTALVRELLGSVGTEVLLETTNALFERRATDALRIVDRLSNEGKDLGQFAGELIAHLRTLVLLQNAPEVALSEIGSEERGPLEEQAKNIPTAEVVRLIEALGEARGRIRRRGDPKLELELVFLKLARNYTEPSVENLLSRLEKLERAVESGEIRAAAPSQETPEAEATDEETPEAGEEVAAGSREPEADDEPEDDASGEGERDGAADTRMLAARWEHIMQELRRRRKALTAAVYHEARVEGFVDGVLELSFPEAFYVDQARKPEHSEPLRELLEEHLGTKPRLEFRFGKGTEEQERKSPAPVEDIAPEERKPEGAEFSRFETKEESEGEQEPEEPSPESAGSNGIIGSQREVFEIFREKFGTQEQHRGS